MKKKMIIPIICFALALGMLSGCTQENTPTNEAPVAMFSVSSGTYVNTEITFTDDSTDDGTIESWTWGFGDGTTSTDQNPTHTYDAIGTYTVTLTVTDDQGETDTYTLDVDVTYTPPTAMFTYEPMEDITNETEITFTDTSTMGDANISTWSWDFGDETNSTEQNPTHTFAAAGTYTVTLTVVDENEMESIYSADITVV